jgi:ATP-dependent helicase HrpB
MLRVSVGNVLCFLPGAAEIQRTTTNLVNLLNPLNPLNPLDPLNPVNLVLPLYGSLSAEQQDRAIGRSSTRRVIVSTNIAETSLTVPGVTAVVDSGLQKVARYDAERGIDTLETERVTADAADQRAGRAGREAPGLVRRLWDARDRLRAHCEPDVRRVDLAGPALDVFAWGGDPRTLGWFEAPPRESIDRAVALLQRLELVRAGRLTPLGERVRRLPLHPRLGRMLVAAGGATEMARACALLSERHLLPAHAVTTTSDLLSALDRWDAVSPHVARAAQFIAACVLRQAQGASSASGGPRTTRLAQRLDEAAFRRAILAGYPDRVAQRREPGSSKFLLATGSGAALGRQSGVLEAEFVAALDVSTVTSAGARDAEPIIRMASRVEREWLAPTDSMIVHRFEAAAGRVKAARVDRYDALVLGEHPVPVDPTVAATVLADAWRGRGPSEEDRRLLARLAFAGISFNVDDLVNTAAMAAQSLRDVRLADALSRADRHQLDRDAPATIEAPSGRTHRIEYNDDGSVALAVKLQELFGLAETPRIGRQRTPLRIELLAPNGRPVQVTQDLKSFWQRTYPDVRKELRGRYPKHPWPEDPWTAQPTARAGRAGRAGKGGR